MVDWQRTEQKVLSSVMVGGVRDRKLTPLWKAIWVTDGRVTHLTPVSSRGLGPSLQREVNDQMEKLDTHWKQVHQLQLRVI